MSNCETDRHEAMLAILASSCWLALWAGSAIGAGELTSGVLLLISLKSIFGSCGKLSINANA
ncbi:MAG: hypothetical protein ACKPKO_15500, partial [Candidatus Fonsibacter sp.]